MGIMINRVLVVDDEPSLLQMTKAVLEAYGGWAVVLASSGREAIAIAAKERPDLILMDAMMPGMDGVEAIGKLKASPETSAIPIVMFTAKVDDEARVEYARAGVIGVVSKPFNPRSIGEELRAM